LEQVLSAPLPPEETMTPVDTQPSLRPQRSLLRRQVRRVPGAHAAYRVVHRVEGEVNALGHWLRAEASQRLRPGARLAAAPPQAPSRRGCALEPVADVDALERQLADRGVRVQAGAEGVYVPPQPGLGAVLGELARGYPADAGFKLLPADAAGGLAGAQGRLRVACALHAEGVGPRPLDVVTLPQAGLLATVLTHVEGEPATEPARAAAVARIAQAARAAGLVAHDDGWQAWHHFLGGGEDALAGFVGADHFALADPHAAVNRRLSRAARDELHFGLEYRLRGGRYLYQSVPAVGASGRRDSGRRWRFMSGLLAEQDVSVRDRLVLDVGCNAGMMLAATLADGAAWGVGWDRPAVARRGRELLLGLGFSRHDLIPGELDPDRPLAAEVPPHLRERLDGAIVLYLAIRHHVGWLRALAEIPWRALLYEGGEQESVATLEDSLRGLRELCDFDVAAAVDFRDGEGDPRPVAVLVRRPSKG
jgi:SAM-dependent methyltransferase